MRGTRAKRLRKADESKPHPGRLFGGANVPHPHGHSQGKRKLIGRKAGRHSGRIFK